MKTRFHFWSAGKGLSEFCAGAEPDPFLLVKRRKLLGFHRSITFDTVSINGWDCMALGYAELDAGKKTKGKMSFYEIDTKAEVKSIEEIQDIEFLSHSYNPDTYDTLTSDVKYIIIMK